MFGGCCVAAVMWHLLPKMVGCECLGCCCMASSAQAMASHFGIELPVAFGIERSTAFVIYQSVVCGIEQAVAFGHVHMFSWDFVFDVQCSHDRNTSLGTATNCNQANNTGHKHRLHHNAVTPLDLRYHSESWYGSDSALQGISISHVQLLNPHA